jgi:hypothetical protein
MSDLCIKFRTLEQIVAILDTVEIFNPFGKVVYVSHLLTSIKKLHLSCGSIKCISFDIVVVIFGKLHC